MASKYATEWASALADVKAAGAAIAFAAKLAGTYVPATDSWTPTASTPVAGYAIQQEPDTDKFGALSLIAATSAILFFVPSTIGQLPALGASCTWGAQTYTVRDLAPVAVDGVAIAATITVSADTEAAAGIAAAEAGRVRAGPTGKV